MAIFRKPDSNITKETNNVGSFLGALLLGPLFFGIIGEWGHFFLNLILNLTLGFYLWFNFMGWIVPLVYAFFSISIVNEKWKKKGWIREDEIKHSQLPKNKFAQFGINIFLIAGWFYFWLHDTLFGSFNNNIDKFVHHIFFMILGIDFIYEDDFIFVILKYLILIVPPILFIKYIWFNKAKINRSKD